MQRGKNRSVRCFDNSVMLHNEQSEDSLPLRHVRRAWFLAERAVMS